MASTSGSQTQTRLHLFLGPISVFTEFIGYIVFFFFARAGLSVHNILQSFTTGVIHTFSSILRAHLSLLYAVHRA